MVTRSTELRNDSDPIDRVAPERKGRANKTKPVAKIRLEDTLMVMLMFRLFRVQL
jgi:hypothetical protein